MRFRNYFLRLIAKQTSLFDSSLKGAADLWMNIDSRPDRHNRVASTPLSDEVARLLVDQYGLQANPAEMVKLRCDDVISLISTVSQTDAVFLGVLATARAGLDAGSLVELNLKPKLSATARFAYVTLAGRTEAPAMAYFRQFLREHLRE